MNTEMLKNYIEQHKENIISDLAGFISIPSISLDKVQVQKALDYILNLAEEMGFETERAADDRVGVISMGAGEETLGILSHVDVVPPGDIDQWETDPFIMTEKDGKLFGRGTLDDKGAVIASLYAMKAVKDCGFPLYKKVQLIMGTQEEVEWSDMDAYVEERKLPDYGFTPDGEFPLCNIEKGGIDLELKFPLNQPEADGCFLTDLQAGTAKNAVPGRCRAELTLIENGKVVSRDSIETTGKSVHSCQPEKGENAIFIMAEQLKERGLSENRLYVLLQWLSEKLSDVYGRPIELYSESEYYNGEFVHRTVLSPTLVWIEAGVLFVNVNIRFAYGTEPERILERFTALAEEQGGKMEIVTVSPAVYVAKSRPFIEAFGQAYEEGCGRKNEFALEYGGTYAKAIPNIVSWGPIFPGEEDTCHEINEYIKVDSLLDNGKIFAIAIGKIVSTEKSFL